MSYPRTEGPKQEPDLISSTMQSLSLSSQEEQALEEFTRLANEWRLTEDGQSLFHHLRTIQPDFSSARSGSGDAAVNELSRSVPHIGVITKATAVKFLMARKFDVERAMLLYRQYQIVRHSLGLNKVDVNSEPLRSELHSGKFTVLDTKDKNGATIAVLTAKLHHYNNLTADKERCVTIQAILLQLDAALTSRETQRNGLMLIYDMTDSRFANFDRKLAKQLLEILRGGFPARLKTIIIVDAPSWLKLPYEVLKRIVSAKMLDRLFMKSRDHLTEMIPYESLPVPLGGIHEHNHEKWLEVCKTRWAHSEEHPGHPTLLPLSQPWLDKNGVVTSHKIPSHSSGMQNGADEPSVGDSVEDSKANLNVSIHRRSDKGMDVKHFVKLVHSLGKDGILREYDALRMAARTLPDKDFHSFRLAENRAKNRYVDVPCFESSRVKLINNPSGEDYIHANFVDGYEQKNAFISTQGPMPKTFPDFWLMVWEQDVRVIVMTTRTVERGKQKCGQYWPAQTGESMEAGSFVITSQEVKQCGNHTETKLLLKSTERDELRNVVHLQFTDWPDYGVPSSASSMFDFIQTMRSKQAAAVEEMKPAWTGPGTGPPVLVHCSAGIGRSGSLCALDICLHRMDDCGLVDLHQSVVKLRSQRCQSIQMPEQYLFCYLALVEYAVKQGLISHEDSGIDELLPWLHDED